MNHYRTSDGTKVSKSYIDRQVRKAKEQKINNMLEDQGYIACEDCGKSAGEPLDCSHELSVDYCQKNGISELAWSQSNIKIRCRTCHKKHDKNLIITVK